MNFCAHWAEGITINIFCLTKSQIDEQVRDPNSELARLAEKSAIKKKQKKKEKTADKIIEMELNYRLGEIDYLEHQLFLASTSDRIKKQRIKSLVIVTLAFLSLSFLFYTTDNKFMMYSFGIFSVLTVIFYPFYLRRHYYNHYKKFIADTYKNRFNEPCKIIFSVNSIDCFDITGETKINNSIIEEIIETGKYIYLKIKTGGHLIIPKLNVENIAKVQTNLTLLADNLKINYSSQLEWRWK